MVCPAGTICNDGYVADCNPCAPLNAETCQFDCPDPNGSDVVFNDGSTLICSLGHVCNSAYLDTCAPCTPIVCTEPNFKCNPNKEKEVTISGLTLTCLDDLVCNANLTYPCDACVLPQNANKYPPDCNDGEAISNPCRPGRPGSREYYKCRRLTVHDYDYEIKNCLFQIFDATCRNKKNICK